LLEFPHSSTPPSSFRIVSTTGTTTFDAADVILVAALQTNVTTRLPTRL
jgi:hypothetical protein